MTGSAGLAHRWAATGVAPGTVLAAVWRIDRPVQARIGHIGAVHVEAAFHGVAAELTRVADEARRQGRDPAADIVATGALIAADPALVDAAARAAAAHSTETEALQANRDGVEGYARLLAELPDETRRERAADVRRIGRRVVEGLDLPDGAPLLVDADAGEVVAYPAGAEVAQARVAADRDGRRRAELAGGRGWAHVTADGQVRRRAVAVHCGRGCGVGKWRIGVTLW